MKIHYLLGDATKPIDKGHKVIVHCCNDRGTWGAGFVLALNRQFGLEPMERYRKWWGEHYCIYPVTAVKGPAKPFKQGQIQVVPVNGGGHADDPNKTSITYVCNLIGQSGCGYYNELPPVRYGAIHEGLIRLREWIKSEDSYSSDPYSIHAPRFGTGLADGVWSKIEEIINDVFSETDINIYVYDFKE